MTFHADPFMDLIDAAVAHIVSKEDADAFRTWMREPDRIAAMVPERDPDAERAVATALTRLIWNATPLPGNRFRPRPLSKPERNAPCPCGSGQKFKRCCAVLPPVPELDTDEIWQIAIGYFSTAQLERALEQGAIPPRALTELAARWLDDGRTGKAVALLESLFTEALDRLDGRYEYAFDLLCDAHATRGHHRKKRALIDRFTREARSELRAAAWQRLASVLMDEGDNRGAWHAFHEAQRTEPDHPALVALEVSLLMGEGRADQAAERARFWRRRLERTEYADEGVLAFLDRVAADPGGAMLMPADDEVTGRLRDILDAGAKRPIPEYRIVPVEDATDADADPKEALIEHMRSLGADETDIERMAAELESMQLEGAADQTEEGREWGDSQDWGVVEAPAAITDIESDWHDFFPASKPFSVSLESLDDEDVWEPGVAGMWIAFLDQQPAVFDSLDVLDDLATAMYMHPALGLPGMEQRFYAPLLERAVAILDAALAVAEGPVTLPWLDPDNRPVLRLLYRYGLWLAREGRDDEAQMRYRQLLVLNPNDNHGVRTLEVNQLLRDGQDREALELCDRYPDDTQLDLQLGRVVAYTRLNELSAAHDALHEVHQCNPHVIGMLAKERVRQPKLNPRGIRMGGKDEAWIYREEMRDVWLAVPGLLAWAQRQIKGR